MVYFGKGFTYTELYAMPVHFRNLYMKFMIEEMQKEKERMQNQMRDANKSEIKIPDVIRKNMTMK